MKKVFLLLLAVVWQAGSARAQARPGPETFVIYNVTVIDATGAPAQSGVTVVVKGDHIAGIFKSRGFRDQKSTAFSIDGTGKFLIPGLWDMHVHLAQPNTSKWGREVFLPLFVANGVTGVRDMGGDFAALVQWRAQIEQGTLLGPRIVAAGAALDGPPDEPDASTIVVRNAAEAREAVAAQKQRGVDFIKVLSFPPRDAYFAVAEEARRRGLPFAGHLPESIRGIEASEAGQRSIEHFSGIWQNCSRRETEMRNASIAAISNPDANPALIERIDFDLPPRGAFESYDKEKANRLFAVFAKNGTWMVPTFVTERGVELLVANRYPEDDPRLRYIPAALQTSWRDLNLPKKLAPEDLADLSQYCEKNLSLVALMHRAGVKFLAGTDSPYPPLPGFSLHEELGLMVEGGLTPMEALQTATLNPAKFFGMEDRLGTVEKGRLADLVLLDANPLDDIRNTQKIAAVIVNGRYLSRAELDRILASVETAARVATSTGRAF